MSLATITSTLGMLATLALAYGMDRWLFLQQRYARQSGNFTQTFLWEILGGIILCVVWLALSWIIIVKNRLTMVVSIIFIVIGLLAFVWYPLQFASRWWAIHLWIFQTSVDKLQYSGLFIAVLGCLTLLLPKRSSE